MRKAAASISTVLARMRRERLSLHSEINQRRGRVIWYLTDGTEISATLAAQLIIHPNIRPEGDALPLSLSGGGRVTCQTYRFVS